MPEMLLVRNAARVLNTSPKGVWALIEAGLIPHKKMDGNIVMVPSTGLEKLALTREDIVNAVRAKISRAARPQEGAAHGKQPDNF